MSRRMPPALYIQRKNQLIARDGDVCLLCLLEAGGRDPGPIRDATIDHLDNRKSNHSLRNLTRMCRAHNTAERNRIVAGHPRLLTADNVAGLRALAAEIVAARNQASANPLSRDEAQGTCGREREGEEGVRHVVARMIRDRPEIDRDDEIASTMQDLMPHVFRLWVFQQVNADGFITQSDAIHAGSEHVMDVTGRGSEQTIGRYWKQITSRAGWLEEVRDDRGRLVWRFRAGRDLHELELKLRGRAEALKDLMRR